MNGKKFYTYTIAEEQGFKEDATEHSQKDQVDSYKASSPRARRLTLRTSEMNT